MTGAEIPTVRITRRLPAPPEAVFAAWTEPGQVRQWLCGPGATVTEAELDVRVGGRFRIVMRDGGVDYPQEGEFLAVEPPRRLVMTWQSETTRNAVTRLTVELRPHGDGTELTLTHERFPDAETAGKFTFGWGAIVDNLAAHCAAQG